MTNRLVIGTNQGEPVIGLDSTAGKGYLNICKRILGLEVPYINLEYRKGILLKDLTCIQEELGGP